MSNSINYVALFANATTSSTSSSILSTLYSNSTTSGGAASALSALTEAENNETQDVAQTAKEPQVQRDIATFTSAVQSATSVKQLLSNPTVLKVLLSASGLADQTSYTALAQQALMSDPSNSTSLVNQLSNTSWKTAAETYQFATEGLSIIQNPKTIASVTQGYAEYTWRASLDTTTSGLSNALTFRSEASSITSVDQILGDSVMRDVVTTALGLPLQIALQPLEAQEKAISTRLDITKFSDPKFTESFVQRYLIAKASSSSNSSSSSSSLISLAEQSASLVV